MKLAVVVRLEKVRSTTQRLGQPIHCRVLCAGVKIGTCSTVSARYRKMPRKKRIPYPRNSPLWCVITYLLYAHLMVTISGCLRGSTLYESCVDSLRASGYVSVVIIPILFTLLIYGGIISLIDGFALYRQGRRLHFFVLFILPPLAVVVVALIVVGACGLAP